MDCDDPDAPIKKAKNKREDTFDYFSTLEKDVRKLNLTKYDLEFDVDPLFKTMTVKFGESGAKGLLLNSLILDSDLDLLLESKEGRCAVGNAREEEEKGDAIVIKEESDMKEEGDLNEDLKEDLKDLKDNEKMDISNADIGVVSGNANKSGDKSIPAGILSIIESKYNFYSIYTELKIYIKYIKYSSNIDTKISLPEMDNIQICHNLTYFDRAPKKAESIFEQNFITSLNETTNNNNTINNDNQPEQERNFLDDSEFDMDIAQENPSQSQHSSNLDEQSPQYDDNINDLNDINPFDDNPMLLKAKNGMMSFNEGFSMLKSDEIKEYIQQFGDGNKTLFKNFPQFQNFTKSFNQLEKLNTAPTVKRVKKEDALFDFTLADDIEKEEVFELESKTKKKLNRDGMRKEKKHKRRVRGFYFYDKFM